MSEANREQSPPGWSSAPLSDVSAIVMGQSPPSSTYNTQGRGLPFFQGKAEFGGLYPEPRVWCSVPGKIAEPDDILLSVRAPVGPTNLAPARCCIGRGLAAIRPESGINLRYLLHAFRRFATELDAKGTGTTFKAVSGKVVREFLLPVSPTAEQNRIADTLDELFSDLDAGVAALERVREKLKLYRASVLKAAVEGALTAEWRAQHPHTEPASQLLQRILAARRHRWEEDQLAKFKARGREPPKNWKGKYKEPAAPDTGKLSTLPSGWCWSSLGECFHVQVGATPSRADSNYWGGSIPWVASGEVQFCRIYDTREKITNEALENSSTRLNPAGSVILNMIGEGRTRGKAGILEIAACNNQNCAAIWISVTPLRPTFVYLWLLYRYEQTRELGSGNNQAAMNKSIVEDIPFPLPPLAEQEVIIEAVEDQLSVIDHLETDLDSKLKVTQGLRQAIMRQAFTGQLVPQDPNDEPASELLKRIAAEREARDREAAASKGASNGLRASQRGRRNNRAEINT